MSCLLRSCAVFDEGALIEIFSKFIWFIPADYHSSTVPYLSITV
jgi:hypothetical protein